MTPEMVQRFYDHTTTLTDDYGQEHLLWTGVKTRGRGTGTVSWRDMVGSKNRTARSVYWEIVHGERAELRLDVSCGIRLCLTHVHERNRPAYTPEVAAYRREYAKHRIMYGRKTEPVSERLLPHIETLWAAGMSTQEVAVAAGLHHQTLHSSVLRCTRARVVTVEKVLAVQPRDHTSVWHGRRQDPIGCARRLQGLMYDGFTQVHLAKLFPDLKDHRALNRLCSGDQGYVSPGIAERISDLYAKLENQTPDDLMIPRREQKRCRTQAIRRGYAPRHCWDEDTIDDPKAIPEWTGRCGTAKGYEIHRREKHLFLTKRANGTGYQKFFGCPPCRAAAHAANVGRRKSQQKQETKQCT